MPIQLNVEPETDEQMAKFGAAAVDAVAAMNLIILADHPEWMMSPAQAGVQYDPPPVSYRTYNHSICSIPEVLRRGHAKCDSITAWEVAWRRARGEDAFTGILPQGDGLFHVVTFVRKNGRIDVVDASYSLGMYNGYGCSSNPNDETCEC